MSMKADSLIRLYPRHWRERYGDELRALLADTSVTPAVLFDLIVGASREWIRVLTVDPGPAESAAREGWRNFRRSSFATMTMAGTTWCLARALMRAGVDPEGNVGYLMVLALIVMAMGWRGIGRRTRFQYPEPKDLALQQPDDLPNPGIGRRQFWMRIVVFGVGLTAWWMVELSSTRSYGPLRQFQPFFNWFLLHQQISLLRESTKTFLTRARTVTLLEVARRRAALPPSPWS